MFAKSSWKAMSLLIGVLVVAITISTPAMANRHGIWWGLHKETFTITLINLTDQRLIATSNNAAVGPDAPNACYPYAFEHFSVHVDPYDSAIWKSDVSDPWPSSVQQTLEFGCPPETYRAWKLDWVDNDNDGVPSE